MEKTKKFNHREIGKKLSLFSFDETIGSGYPFWLEKGNILKGIISKYINDLQRFNNIEIVKTPLLGTKDLYETSGHVYHYSENMYPPMCIDDKKYILRPMTCPHHILLMKQRILTHKSLPTALGENALLFRYEYSGGVIGLERVREMELIDIHSFATREQSLNEIIKFSEMIFQIVKTFDITLESINLSIRCPKKKDQFHNNENLWIIAEEILENSLKIISKKQNIPYIKDVGAAAFYGPKIDFQIKTLNNKNITLSTIQIDLLLASKFNLQYLDINQKPNYPCVIHVGLIGTLERFISYLLEKHQGKLPIWLCPIQVIIIPIISIDDILILASKKLNARLLSANIRSAIDIQKHTLNKKIKNARDQFIPFIICLGNKEADDSETIIYKNRSGQDNISSVNEFISLVQTINNKYE